MNVRLSSPEMAREPNPTVKSDDPELQKIIDKNKDNPHFMRMLLDEDYFVEYALGILEGVRHSPTTARKNK